MSVAEAKNRSYHHGDLRQALLDATRELLSEGGIEAATLRAVARRAGVSNRAPYHHFADKCCLLAAVAAEGFERLLRAMERGTSQAGDDPISRLIALSKSYLSFAEDNPGEFQVMFWHEVCDPEAFRDRGEKASEALQFLLDSIAALAQEPIEEERLLSMAVTSWSTVHGFATLRAQGNFIDDGQLEKGPTPHVGQERLGDDLCTRAATALAAEIAGLWPPS